MEAEVERQRRGDEEQAKSRKGEKLAAVDTKAFLAEKHHHGHNHPCEAEAVEKHRGSVHALGIEVEGTEGVGAIGDGSADGAEGADKFF